MPSNMRERQDRKLNMYFLAGVATAATFMEEFAWRMKMNYEEEGGVVHTELLFPYGDWYVPRRRQLNEIRKDLLSIGKDRTKALGGQRMASAIRAHHREGAIWIMGHSGGGVAGIHAAELLRLEGIPVERVIQIGSPRCRIPLEWQKATSYVFAVNARGKIADPITRLGSWGGWELSGRGVPLWNPVKYAPAHRVALPLIGGHPDYFRSREPFLDEQGVSNLEHVLRVINQTDTTTKM